MSAIKYKGKTFPIAEGSTAQQTLEALKMVMPELENATLKKDGEDYTALVEPGTKG